VLDNMRIGSFAGGERGGRWFISWRRERRQQEATFERYGLEIRPQTPVSSLSPLERALIAIVRALEELPSDETLGARRGMLVLDEPTVFLPRNEVEGLFRLIRTIRDGGGSVLFVSHDLDEVREITDRVTVLRDGRTVATAVTAQTPPSQLVEMIVGHRIAALARDATPPLSEEPAVSVEGLRGPGVDGISFALRRGEILGITGLLGSGFEKVPYLLFDALAEVEGTLRIDGQRYDVAAMAPRQALDAGVALLPGDRREGGVDSLSLLENVMLPVLDDYWQRGALRRGAMRSRTRAALGDCDVRPPDPAAKFASLSGGNQQKALLAKWLQDDLRLLLVHEPTQGVDVGAREQITALLRARAAGGVPMLCASSDHEQLALLCDRALVFHDGRIVDELSGLELTKERLTDSCLRSTTAVTAALDGSGALPRATQAGARP